MRDFRKTLREMIFGFDWKFSAKSRLNWNFKKFLVSLATFGLSLSCLPAFEIFKGRLSIQLWMALLQPNPVSRL